MPKINNPRNVCDLHPITLLLVLSKIIEIVVYKQLITFLENNNRLSPKQYGFRKGKSTIDASFMFVYNIYSNENVKQITSAIFIDYKKAFDSISQQILLDKLTLYNISETTISWFQNFLDGLKQRTHIDNTNSQWKEIMYGVPQGSTLGPLYCPKHGLL